MSLLKKIGELFKAPTARENHSYWFYHTKVFSKKILLLYNAAMKAEKENKVLKTTEHIAPPELAFNMFINEVISKWGKPRCTFNNNKTAHNIQVFFYRKDYVYESILFQLQFYNDRLFFVCLEIGKSLMSEDNKMTMLSKMLPNFIEEGLYKDVHSIPAIMDANQNYLLVQDDVVLNICYLSGEFAGEKLALIEEGKKHVPSNNQHDDD